MAHRRRGMPHGQSLLLGMMRDRLLIHRSAFRSLQIQDEHRALGSLIFGMYGQLHLSTGGMLVRHQSATDAKMPMILWPHSGVRCNGVLAARIAEAA